MHEQLVLFGAPGTGKSSAVKKRLSSYGDDKIFRVTIHPEFLYTDFVGQLLPESLPNGVIQFTFKEGPFTRALMEAYSDSSKEVFLVLEELSRGNVAAIFGDIFQLLDRNQHFESNFPIRNKNIADRIPTLTTDEIKLPSNFNIICTVNMNDQNVFPMDTAFKRRFDWEYVSTQPAVDSAGNVITTLNNPKIMISLDNNKSNDIDTTWQSFYMALNSFITDKEKGLGKKEDKQIGQFFINFENDLVTDSHSSDIKKSENAYNQINKFIRNKLLIYLWQDIEETSKVISQRRIFDSSINSYDELYSKYGNDKVFSDFFINNFLLPNKSLYPY